MCPFTVYQVADTLISRERLSCTLRRRSLFIDFSALADAILEFLDAILDRGPRAIQLDTSRAEPFVPHLDCRYKGRLGYDHYASVVGREHTETCLVAVAVTVAPTMTTVVRVWVYVSTIPVRVIVAVVPLRSSPVVMYVTVCEPTGASPCPSPGAVAFCTSSMASARRGSTGGGGGGVAVGAGESELQSVPLSYTVEVADRVNV